METFNTTEKNIALQQISGSEGISLKAAEYLVYYNFGYSGKKFYPGPGPDDHHRPRRKYGGFCDDKRWNQRQDLQRQSAKRKRYNEKLFLKGIMESKLQTRIKKPPTKRRVGGYKNRRAFGIRVRGFILFQRRQNHVH